MSTYTQCILQTMKPKEKKNTFEKKGSYSLYWNVLERSEKPSIQGVCWSCQVGRHCCDTLRLLQGFVVILGYVGIFGTRKTYGNTSSFFFSLFFCKKRILNTSVDFEYPCQMCNPQTWVVFHYNPCRGCCEASFIDLFGRRDMHNCTGWISPMISRCLS